MFIDQARIHVKAGDGGDGCVSFRREKYVPRGGPDGGNGGHGGSLILEARTSVETLLDFRYRRRFSAKDGRPGGGGKRNGAAGEDLVIPVPVGTVVYDNETGVQLRDLDKPGMAVTVVEGGRGGRGNTAFKSATNQVPRESQDGIEGQERSLRLELKLIADIGLAGLPNAGKSTLLGRTTHARPRIAAYPFTTLAPNLGIVELPDYRRMVMADIPGLIEGSHQGHGMGDDFLRHIERTHVIIHVVDMAPPDGPPPAEAWRIIEHELEAYSLDFSRRPHLIAANKMDLPDAEDNLKTFRRELAYTDKAEAIDTEADIIPISATSGHGVRTLLEKAYKLLQEHKKHSRA